MSTTDHQIAEALTSIVGYHIYSVDDLARAAYSMGVQPSELLQRAQEQIGL